MIKYSFQNDYSEGAHPRILEALARTNLEQDLGYGEDRYCAEAADAIRRKAGSPDADVHFISGGTQANLILLASCLRPFESVIAAQTGHIAVHEAGAIEMSGHKINTVAGCDGKVTGPEVEAVVAAHTDEHMVRPRVVFVSQSTEVGTIYSAAELRGLSDACKRLGLYLYLDGARLGSALACRACDMDLAELASLVDAFYVGGTKNGALMGEALVVNHPQLKPDLRYVIKQHGGLLAKGRLFGVQFGELFRDDLYLELARHANAMAEKLTGGLRALGYTFLTDSPTNQIFPILPNGVIAALSEMYRFYVWAPAPAIAGGGRSAVRLVTSWATPEGAVEEFVADVARAGRARL